MMRLPKTTRTKRQAGVLFCGPVLFSCLLMCFHFDALASKAGWRTQFMQNGKHAMSGQETESLRLCLRGGSNVWPSPRREGSRSRYEYSPMRSEELDEEEDFVDYVEKSTVQLRKEKEREHLVEQFGGGLDSCLKKHESVLERRKRLAREARQKRKEKEAMLQAQEGDNSPRNKLSEDVQVSKTADQHDGDRTAQHGERYFETPKKDASTIDPSVDSSSPTPGISLQQQGKASAPTPPVEASARRRGGEDDDPDVQ